jgi:hypothetical protein
MFICLPKKEIFTRHTEKNIPMIYRLPYPWYLTPYQWYFDALPMAFWPPTYGISPPPLIHGILTHLPMVYWPPIHGNLTPLPMVYRTPYPWYFDPSAYLLIRNEGVKVPYRGVNIPWMKIDPGVNLPWGSKYHMTPFLSSFITYHRICNQINMSTTSGTGATYLSRALEFTPVFSGVCVTRSLVLCVCFVDHCLSFWFTDSYYPFGILKLFLRKSFYSFPNRLLC